MKEQEDIEKGDVREGEWVIIGYYAVWTLIGYFKGGKTVRLLRVS